MRASNRCKQKIKQLEGFRSLAYRCEAGEWTFGYGFTDDVNPGDTITRAEADARLDRELVEYEEAVWSATKGNANQNEFDAMLCLTWNIGIDAFLRSSVLRAHNRGDKPAASRAFGLWNKIKVNGKIKTSTGLTSRRAVEAAWYLEDPAVKPEAITRQPEAENMPQKVQPEAPMRNSTTVIAGGTAAVATAVQVAEQVVGFKDSIEGLGDWLIPVLLVITLMAVGWVIYERFNARSRGNA